MKNPLLQYKHDQKISWPELEERTGICWRTCHRLAHATPKELDRSTAGTLRKVYEAINVNLINWKDN